MPQLFLCRKNRLIQETWNGTGKSSVSSLIRMSTGSQLPVAVGLARLLAHGWDPSVPVGTPAYHLGFPLCIQFMIPGDRREST
jgi:hypothetical protein